jgi:lactose/L-arabinose transport system substrate-binding protein
MRTNLEEDFMKKLVGFIVLALMLVSFSACSKQKSATADAKAVNANAPVTLTVWCWDPNFNIYAMNEAAKIYKTINPNVTVNVVETPWNDLQQKLITSLSAKATDSLPDIILMQDNAAQKNIITYPDAFYDLTGKVDLSKFAQFKVDVSTVNGKNYGVPFDNGATATFLRTDYLEKAGLKASDFQDITWEKFIELGKIVKAKTGISMLSSISSEPDFIMIMLQSSGSWMFDNAGKVTIANNEALKTSLKIYKELVDTGVCKMVTDWNEYISTLNSGTIAGTVQGVWIIGSITADKAQSGKWAVVNTPRLGSIPKSVNYSSQGGSGWMVLASSSHPDVAADFLAKTFAGSVDFYQTILPSSGAISTWAPAATGPVYSQPQPFFGGQKIYSDIIGYSAKVPNVKYGVYNYEARDAIGRALQAVLKGADIDKELETAQKNVEFLIKQ